jgi:bifunctional non-homologous end joining protein LigD
MDNERRLALKSGEGMRTLKIGRHSVVINNQSKVLFSRSNITKGDLITYYRLVGPTMLPHLKNRPLTMHRFPDGIMAEGFYQKEIGKYFPAWISRATVPRREGGTTTYVICNHLGTLIYLANQACITTHLWLSKTDKITYPDRMIFDLDPDTKSLFTVVKKMALELKKILESYGLCPYAMLTGSRGMHVIVPLTRTHTFTTVKVCAKKIAARLLAQDKTDTLTTDIRLKKRKGKLFIDVNRNAYAQTAVAPYAVRPLPGAPVATPVTWKEVASTTLTPQKFTIKNIGRRLKKTGDPLASIHKTAGSLSKFLSLN